VALLLSQRGQTALSIACSGGRWDMARWLIDAQDVELVRLGHRVGAASSVSSASEC
jgi:hypothetical protein